MEYSPLNTILISHTLAHSLMTFHTLVVLSTILSVKSDSNQVLMTYYQLPTLPNFLKMYNFCNVHLLFQILSCYMQQDSNIGLVICTCIDMQVNFGRVSAFMKT